MSPVCIQKLNILMITNLKVLDNNEDRRISFLLDSEHYVEMINLIPDRERSKALRALLFNLLRILKVSKEANCTSETLGALYDGNLILTLRKVKDGE